MTGHAVAATLATALLLAQAGVTPRVGPTTPAGPMLDQLNRSMTRPVPTLPAPSGRHPADVWVPDRIVPVPGHAGGVLVPGHWERRISDREHYVPPMVIRAPDGTTTAVPGGVMPAPDQRPLAP
ncbi:MAG: hypothetical protein FJ027_22975 [Candidatus Rokubacteria bacterium]|nr:hypothetical protein [Candidatus Rokubacteria bacterium]